MKAVAMTHRMSVLDGWRAVSILSVLACHLLSLGPKSWDLNAMAGPFGMSLFFTLSGFLITSTLLERADVRAFFIRRACRILPLAFLYISVAMALMGAGAAYYLAHYAFTINYQHLYITELTSHFWSLCVEIHFYVFAGLLVAVLGRKGLLLLPLVGLGVTAVRIYTQTTISIETHLRVDEILAGASVALIHHGHLSSRIKSVVGAIPLPVIMLGFLVASHPSSGAFNYLRPYLGAATVANSMWRRAAWMTMLEGRAFKYIADISYALYVIHGIFRSGWFATGGTMERYLIKRPIGIALTFALAHLSTFYYESKWIRWGKAWSERNSVAAKVPELVQ